ncbi:acyl-lipid (9-3)-desaturase [Lingula anatina]|uniref:Acyl-lipid (9-3)-desaturase n=1 Tax=Lingula anatina TaxID=7574 RepID=A0A1S3JMF9_LINAN|nr:acyl-lipid (9-3)-desaturase [Lingula anatina]|eukprot:XP_013411094.1 acyl-lipid (9-3)-desaturase [Lingula anatina]
MRTNRIGIHRYNPGVAIGGFDSGIREFKKRKPFTEPFFSVCGELPIYCCEENNLYIETSEVHTALSRKKPAKFLKEETSAKLRFVKKSAGKVSQKEKTQSVSGEKNCQILSKSHPCPSAKMTDWPVYTMDEVSDHCEYSSCWIVVHNYVYDVTTFVFEHPGGEDIILEHGGRDCTYAFEEKGHSRHATMMLEKYCIGMLVENERIMPHLGTRFSQTLVTQQS